MEKDPIDRLLERLKVESLEGIILNTHTDLIENLKIASLNLKKLIQEKDFWFLTKYFSIMDNANTQLSLLSKNYKGGRKHTAKGDRKDVKDYISSLPLGIFDSRKVAEDLKTTPASVGNYFKYHKEELSIRKIRKEYEWEKY